MQYCVQPGCSVLVRRGRCPQHNQKLWYARARWFRLRQQVLVSQAYQCAACGRVQAQLEVDHIVKHDGDPHRFWDRLNLQALCPTCHVAKSQRGG
jgi:5-methylcytosine-specific restriction protein A